MVQPIVIGGPTASGKSHLAIELAKKIGGEIICADSRQVYSGMQIGTAGPSPEELAAVSHHLYGVIDPKIPIDAGAMIALLDGAIREVQAKKRTPILVGGSGLYLRSFRYGLSDVPPRDDKIRGALEKEINDKGLQRLFEELADLDPAAAAKISPMDRVRIVRALEIFRITGQKPSQLRASHSTETPRVDAKWVILFPERQWLNQRLETRIRLMFDAGLVQEAIQLRNHLGLEHALVQTMGYEEALKFSDGILTKDEAVEQTLKRHRDYAKRQMTWFKKEPWWMRLDPANENASTDLLKAVGMSPTL